MSSSACVLFMASSLLASADASGFLVTPRRSNSIRARGLADRQSLDAELVTAVDGALGCGSQVGHEDLANIELRLSGMWRTLPKNDEGNVERRSLRYAVHRYFNREWSLHIRGFEPSRSLNASSWGSDDILGQRVPAFVESVLESSHRLISGFTLRDAATMIATIEQLIFDSESALLEESYINRGRSMKTSWDERRMTSILEYYVVRWLLRTDHETTEYLLAMKPEDIGQHIPHWHQVSGFIQGQLRALQYKRQHAPSMALEDSSARKGHNAFLPVYSFDDAHAVVGGMTKKFAAFWDSECASMKETLYQMDTHRTGRVPLSRFHGHGLDADWRFGESEPYLRELGALDETGWRGKQVIIANYMQSASNCVISSDYYLVCCRNDCESLLDDIETAVGAPSAKPEELLEIVAGMSAQSTLDDDFPPAMEASLRSQLHQISSAHGGEVPLHGRLFAQWLHYAFPRECAFPHKAGVVSTRSPTEYGESYYATREEMTSHANDSHAEVGKEELQWMSQWSEEEELMADYGTATATLRAPWDGHTGLAVGGVSLLLAAGVLAAGASRTSTRTYQGLLPSHGKDRYV